MDARSHFANRLDHETDVADVAATMRAGESDFVLRDARSRAAYDAGHLPGAVSLHHSEITAESVAARLRASSSTKSDSPARIAAATSATSVSCSRRLAKCDRASMATGCRGGARRASD